MASLTLDSKISGNDVTSNKSPLNNTNPSKLLILSARIYYIAKTLLIFPNLLESSLKNIFCLETLRHGTSMKNLVLIKQNGGDPTKGSSDGQKPWEASPNCFYVMRSSGHKKDSFIQRYFLFHIVKRLAPLEYKISSERFDIGASEKNWKLSKWDSFSTAVKGVLNPTIKFYYDKTNIKNDFTKDTRLKGLGLITSKPVKANHLGISGVFKYGINNQFFGRLKSNPLQGITGVIQGLACITILPLAVPSFSLLLLGKILKIDRI